MLRLFILLMFIISSFAFGKDFPADYMDEFQSKNIDLSTTEWIATRPAPNRIFLVHQRLKTFALVTEHLSSVSDEEMEEYFAGDFTEAALKSRENFLKNKDGVLDLQGGSNTHQGIRYGGTSFNVAMEEGIARFHERMWSNDGKLWHIAIASFETATQEGIIHGDMNFLMEKITKTPFKTSSFFNFLIPEAHADERCNINESGKWRDLASIVPRVRKQTKCNDMNIAAQNRGNGYGIKLNLSSLAGCTQGPAAAWNSMKQSFLSGLNTLANATEQKMKQYGCERLKPPQAKTMWQSITNSFAMQSYTDCLQAAATGAMVSQAWQGIKATLSGVKDLYNWVRAGNNPWSAAVAMVTKEVNGFLCLNAAAQAKVVCEYATHYFIAMGVVVATAATGGALAPIAGAGTAARVGLAINRGVAAAKAFIATPYTVTRTIVKTPGRVASAAVARRDKDAPKGPAIVVSGGSAGRARPTTSVRARPRTQTGTATTQTRTPASTTRRAAPAPEVKPDATESADAVAELNRRSLLETRERGFDQLLGSKDLEIDSARAQIDEIGIEAFLDEKGDMFTGSEKAQLTAIYREINPQSDPVRMAELRRMSGLSDADRLSEAKSLLGRNLTEEQMKAIIEAHKVGEGTGRGFFTYTKDEIVKKGNILKNAGFKAEEIRKLMEKGVTGTESTTAVAALDRYDGIRAVDQAKRTVDRIRSTQDPAQITELMQTYRQQNKFAAEAFASEARERLADGDKAYSIVNTGLAIEKYVKAGDAEGAMAMIRSGLGQGMTKEGIVRDVGARLTLDVSSTSPEVVLQRQTWKKILDAQNPRTAAPTPTVQPKPVVQPKAVVAEVKPAPVVAPPKVEPKVETPAAIKQVTPREAQMLANDYRLGSNGKPKDASIASQYYMQAAEDNFKKEMVRKRGYNEGSNYLGDRNIHAALTESLAGDGTVALKMFERLAKETKGGHGLNEFIYEMHEANAYVYKNNPQARANMMKIINAVEQNYKSDLYSPQQSMMRAWRSSNDW